MNPPGKWIFRCGKLDFLNDGIMAIYGQVYPMLTNNYGIMWRWEARVIFEARANSDLPINGFAYTEKEAKNIVECILKNTRTCEFKSGE
jgi:hypothetical protein